MSYFVNNLRCDPATISNLPAKHEPAYTMAANAGVVKAIVSFYRIDLDTAFERQLILEVVCR